MNTQNPIAIYQTSDGKIEINVKIDNETIRLPLQKIADLFGRDKSVISRHIKNIFKTSELSKDGVVAFFATTGNNGKTYQVEYYNLDMIISVGYRVNSTKTTQFRIRATSVLKNHIIKFWSYLPMILRRASLSNSRGKGMTSIISHYQKPSLCRR